MRPFITETWLRENFNLDHASTVSVPADSRLTPSAFGLVEERKIIINYVDEAGRVVNVDYPAGMDPVEGAKVNTASGDSHVSAQHAASDTKTAVVEHKAADTAANKRAGHVNPLTGSSEWHKATCMVCHQPIDKKPDTMTHLDMDVLVPKNDPRLKLRGKLDTLIARVVLIQEEFDPEGRYPDLAKWLGEIRSALGNVLRAEVKGEPLAPVAFGAADAGVIHAISHNPLKYIGMDHFLPEVGRGLQIAKLNLLRAEIREAELIAADLFIARDFTITRPDIMEGLNRLSSAVYVLMLLVCLAEQGKHVALERIVI